MLPALHHSVKTKGILYTTEQNLDLFLKFDRSEKVISRVQQNSREGDQKEEIDRKMDPMQQVLSF